LVSISDNLFASGSLDGAIVVWHAETLSPIKILNYPEKYRNEDKVYIYSVKHLNALSEKYLAACISNSFRIYDISSGDCIMECKSAHDADLTCLIPLYSGVRIISCSVDSSIRIWGSSQKINFVKKAENDNSQKYSLVGSILKKPVRIDSICLGDMLAHSDAVNLLISLNEHSFASCGADGLVILWKDGRIQSEIRNNIAQASIIYHLDSEDTSDKSHGASSPEHGDIDESTTDFDSAKSFSEYTDGENKVQVPEYILDFAEMLATEKKLLPSQIADNLREQGHSDAIVNATLRELRSKTGSL